jgi:hypothetical protein
MSGQSQHENIFSGLQGQVEVNKALKVSPQKALALAGLVTSESLTGKTPEGQGVQEVVVSRGRVMGACFAPVTSLVTAVSCNSWQLK